MSFIIPKKELKDAVNKLAKIVPANSSVPLLGMVKLSIANNILRISATDFTQYLTCVIDNADGGNEPDRSFLLEFSKLKEYASIIGNDKKNIYLDGITDTNISFSVIINGNPVIKEFNVIADDEWPEPEIGRTPGNEFQSRMLEAVKLAAKSAAPQSETRKSLQGVLLEPDAVVASDGKQLVRFECTTGVKNKVVLPLTKFLQLKDTATDGAIRVLTRDNSQFCQIVTNSWSYEVKCLEGNYPNYKQVIPKETANMIAFGVEDITALQTALPLFECSGDIGVVHIYTAGNRVSMLSENLATVQDTKADYSGSAENTILAVNRRILLDAFDLGFDRIKFNDPISAIIATNGTGDAMVFMPIREHESLDTVKSKFQKGATKNIATDLSESHRIQPNNQPEGENEMEQDNAPTTVENGDQTTVANKAYRFKVEPATEPVDPFEELFSAIAEARQSSRATLDMATALQAKARDVQRHLKAKERDFKDTRELLGKLKKVSGF